MGGVGMMIKRFWDRVRDATESVVVGGAEVKVADDDEAVAA
jgi:hypothetical protein